MSVRVCVIGCGWWSTFVHLPTVKADDRAEIAALVDTDESRLQAAAQEFDVGACFTDVEEMLSVTEIDAAVVAVPHAYHHSVTRPLLKRGVHVLLEKPMTIEPEHARDLIEVAGANGAELLIDYPWHYNAQALALRARLHAGEIGKIEHLSCLYASIVRELYRGEPESYRDVFGYTVSAPDRGTYSRPELSGGGQGQAQVTHAAALLLWLTGLKATSVAAMTSTFELAVDLVDGVAIGFEGGAIGVLGSTGSVTPDQEEIMRCEIFGRDGHVVFDVNQGTATWFRGGGLESLPPLSAEERYPASAPVENLIGVVLGAQENGSPAEIGLGAVEIVAAMYRAAAERRVIDIEEL